MEKHQAISSEQMMGIAHSEELSRYSRVKLSAHLQLIRSRDAAAEALKTPLDCFRCWLVDRLQDAQVLEKEARQQSRRECLYAVFWEPSLLRLEALQLLAVDRVSLSLY